MAKILILEDDPNRVDIFRATLGDRHSLAFTETASAAIAAIDSTSFDVIFLDHDLGGQTHVAASDVNTGSEVVRHLAHVRQDTNLDAPIIIHSMNIPEAQAMQKRLIAAGFRHVYQIPFSQLSKNYLLDPGFIV